jgi:PTS system nitrogen regulatory IIA component
MGPLLKDHVRGGETIMETLDINQLAAYLSRDAREVGKLANRGVLPGRKVGGEWRFARAEINHWLESRLHEYSEAELEALESAHAAPLHEQDSGSTRAGDEPLLANLLSEERVAVPLPASTRSSVLRELVKVAESSWFVYDPDVIHSAIVEREEMGSTALASGVAIPHPHRPLGPGVIGESFVVFARTSRGIPFNGPRATLTDLFFLVCCTEDRTHLRVLARLARLMLREGLIDQLRSTETATEAYELLSRAERELLE